MWNTSFWGYLVKQYTFVKVINIVMCIACYEQVEMEGTEYLPWFSERGSSVEEYAPVDQKDLGSNPDQGSLLEVLKKVEDEEERERDQEYSLIIAVWNSDLISSLLIAHVWVNLHMPPP